MVMESTRFGPDPAPAKPARRFIITACQTVQFCRRKSSPTSWRSWTRRKINPSHRPQCKELWLYDCGRPGVLPENQPHAPGGGLRTRNRIRGMVELQECARRLIELPGPRGCPDEDCSLSSKSSNALYDSFIAKYGLINSRGNKAGLFGRTPATACSALWRCWMSRATSKESRYVHRRTIRPMWLSPAWIRPARRWRCPFRKSPRGHGLYAQSCRVNPRRNWKRACRVIYRDIRCAENPEDILPSLADLSRYPLVTADEYLSGKVRQKLRMAKAFLEVAPGNQKETARRNVGFGGRPAPRTQARWRNWRAQ